MNASSAMARETGEASEVVARLLADPGVWRPIVAAIQRQNPTLAVVCGRGSSGHVGVFLRYLIETRLGIPVSATAPSIVTSFKRTLALRGGLFIVVSQSGRSPDLIAATADARSSGALTVALINDAESPVARAAEFSLPIGAGPEISIAATKSVIASMAAAALLIAELGGDKNLASAVARLPERLSKALALDWRECADDLAKARAVFVAARGFGLAPAREIALKMAEILRLPALSYSAAELMHGPRAAIAHDTPVLVLRLADQTASMIDTLVATLRTSGQAVHLCGGPASSLPWIGDDHAVTDAITLLAPAYRLIEATARRFDFDPDRPPHLSKVTETV
ncbi:glutamine--fructose-6-phosphate aminotransferase [Beijerinckiaceae bacterium]|nr:glutamine--fructose-6-phosphate aminotransferase [Beijerinckiaceae bacterium]